MKVSYANRGKSFEDLINFTNERYLEKEIAFIEKKPTPMQILYPLNKGQYVSCFGKKSSVDYSGVCHRVSIYFEAKTCKHRTRFPLDNIKEHQINTLSIVRQHGALAFFLIEFSALHEVYTLSVPQAEKWFEESKNDGRKSIPHKWFVENCNLVESYEDIPLHYLEKLVDQL